MHCSQADTHRSTYRNDIIRDHIEAARSRNNPTRFTHSRPPRFRCRICNSVPRTPRISRRHFVEADALNLACDKVLRRLLHRTDDAILLSAAPSAAPPASNARTTCEWLLRFEKTVAVQDAAAA